MHKVNVDASMSRYGDGLGVVIRDSEGIVVAWRCRKIPYINCPTIGEALVARCAVDLAKEQHMQHIIFEGDCKGVIDQIQNSVPSLSSTGGIIEEIKKMLTTFNYAYFLYGRRDGNNVAHLLARYIILDSDDTSDLPFEL